MYTTLGFVASQPISDAVLICSATFDATRTAWKMSKYGPEITPSLDTFHAVIAHKTLLYYMSSTTLLVENQTGSEKLHDQSCMLTIHCLKSVQMRSFFWSVFSHIRTEYGEILRIFPYSVRMRENTDQWLVPFYNIKLTTNNESYSSVV